MLPIRAAIAITIGALAADVAPALRVLRVTPLQDGPPTAVITVTFDRPVAGSLDRTVDPRAILSVTPAIEGPVDWRDPVTLRLRPSRPLPAGQTYTVTVSGDFASLDGARLAEPYRFSFRVSGPRVLAGLPVGPGSEPRFLEPGARFQIALSSPVPAGVLERLVRLEFARTCPAAGSIALRAVGEGPIDPDAPWQLREAGGWDRDRGNDPLRRLVTLAPERPLPLGCRAELVVPTRLDLERPGELQRWPFATYGRFALAGANCGGGGECPTGPVVLEFSAPVRGAEVLRKVRLLPATTFTVSDTAEFRPVWRLWAELKPRTGYVVAVEPTITDQFGQRLVGNPRASVVTTGFAPSLSYTSGKVTIERDGPRTLAVSYVNVDTLEVWSAPVPDSLEATLLSRGWYSWREHWDQLARHATRRRFAVRAERDRRSIYGVPFPVPGNAAGRSALHAVRITSPRVSAADEERGYRDPIALVQITDLAVHAKLGREEGTVWVTGVRDGKPRAGATVRVRDERGRELARGITDSAGLARFAALARRPPPADDDGEDWTGGFEGSVEARLGDDRAVVGVSQYDPELNLWQFNVAPAWGTDRLAAAAAVFTERGIYRPGDSVFAKAIVRTGPLGALRPPTAGDSIQLVFRDRDGGVLAERVVPPGAFGTAAFTLALDPAAPLGEYSAAAALRREGEWQELGRASFRVGEYRPPEFLVGVTADTAALIDGDSLSATIDARYLFGAPMARAALTWSLRQRPVEAWDFEVPGAPGYLFLARGWWWDEFEQGGGTIVSAGRTDSLDATGRLAVRAPVTLGRPGLPARVSLDAVVTDVNRQSVLGSASVLVHPAEFYLGLKPRSTSYFWSAGPAQAIGVIAVRPGGARVTGVAVRGALIRREWHQVRRESGGFAQLVGEWVADTVDRCTVRTVDGEATCSLTPDKPGNYTVHFAAADRRGRPVATSFHRWVTGPGWVPWADESRFKMDVVPDRSRYTVGDTATVLFASPFTRAEAWVTVEREGILEQRRITIADGATTLRFPVTEAWAPNAFLSIVVARGRSAEPGPLDDPGRPTIRVGYAEVRVTPERKRLEVTLAPDRAEYRPGDEATIRTTVADRGRGLRAEVTLWAVDEGVLALTGYRTPDPVDLLYRPRGLGLRLASNLATLVPQVPQGDKGRNPGGGGGEGGNEVLRSRFRTTAFFLGSVETDSTGVARTTVTLPDNLTTFRVMAVAVSRGDRYGGGESPLLVTRPLLARPALPRFVRPGDAITAGVVVNHRAGGTPTVKVEARPVGIQLVGSRSRSAALEAGRGREVRFDFRAEAGDSAAFRFDVSGAGDRDAVRLAIPIRPATRPVTATIAGVVRDTARVEFPLDPGTDPTRSTLSLSLGTSPLSLLRGYGSELRVYPYLCSEQVASMAAPLIALHRAGRDAGLAGGDTVRLAREVERAVTLLVRRQRDDGGIGLWSRSDWTSPWLTTQVGLALLDARDAGLAVRDTVVAGIAGYLRASLEREQDAYLLATAPLREAEPRLGLAERLAVARFLRRAGQPDRSLENELLRGAAQLAPADRLELAALLHQAGDTRAARGLIEPFWRLVRVEGRAATLPDSLWHRTYMESRLRPLADLLTATLAVEPGHALLGAMLEGVVTRTRTGPLGWWNTRDYSVAVRAIDAWQRRFPAGQGSVSVWLGRRPVLAALGSAPADTAVSLATLVGKRPPASLSLAVRAEPSNGPAFFYLTLVELPREPSLRPEDRGFVVERWYEDAESGRPVTEATEGDLVRVRLRLTVPADRAFVVLDDPLPAGLEAIDLSLRTTGRPPGPGAVDSAGVETAPDAEPDQTPRWAFGGWDAGWWTPFEHREIRDDRVVYSARALWPGTYTATYLARATIPGTFVRPQAHAEEMYNPAVFGRSDGGRFVVRRRGP